MRLHCVMKRLRQASIKEWFDNNQDKKLKSEEKVVLKALMEDTETSKELHVITETDSSSTEISENGSPSEEKNTEEENVLYEDFLKIIECSSSLPPLKPSSDHTVLVKVPLDTSSQDAVLLPYPDVYTDKWEKNYVRLPCSPHSLYPQEEGGEMKVISRWKIIEESLLSDISSSNELENAIMQYNQQYSGNWDFSGMHDFFKNVLSEEETNAFFADVLPKMIRLALQLPHLCTQPIPLLQRHKDHKITMSQKQVACLLANAFFCTFPRRNTRHHRNVDREYMWYPDINFNRLYLGRKKVIEQKRAEKLKCLLNYFRRIFAEEPKGLITFHRVYQQTLPDWSISNESLRRLHVSSEGLIEKEGAGMLQVDFANKIVGGGVLGLGCVQEEIRFVLCPEMILARLFTERLDATEVLIVTGCEQFNKHEGYGNTFRWAGNFEDTTPRDSWKRRCNQVVAMDALPFQKDDEQYKLSLIRREMNKAFCGFYSSPSDSVPAIATGNWGCGIFRGNPRLKMLIQLMAASEAHRDMVYFTFHDKKLQRDLQNMYQFLLSKAVTVGNLWQVLQNYSSTFTVVDGKVTPELYDFIYCAFPT